MEELLPRLQKAIEHSFPAFESPQVCDLVSLNSGWESDVYSFRVKQGPDGSRQQRDLILRIYPGGFAVQKARDEYKALSILHRMHYPVPEVYCLEAGSESLGQPFLIMERIEGTSLWTLLFDGPVEQQAGWLRLFIKLFIQLHTLDWRPFIPEEAEKVSDPYYCVRRQFEDASWQLKNLGLTAEFQPLYDWFNVRMLDVPCTRPSVVHWDFHPQNILVRPNGAALVIDWTGAAISDPRFDLAWTLLLFESYLGPEWRARVLAEYENQAGGAVPGMAFFDAFACARRLFSVAGSIKAGAGALGMRPGAEEIMKKQVEPLRRVAARLKAVTGLQPIDVDRLLS